MAPHLFIIHFPISLIVAGAFLELLGVAMSDNDFRIWGGRFLIAGGVAAFLGFLSGEGAKLNAMSSTEIGLPALESHQQWGSVGAWALLVVAILRSMWRTRFDGMMGWVNGGLTVVAVALVVAITITGTLVRHGL
jgi:uncharacterized membrane protein